eukprot:PhF_6_TR42186/c0_g1_i3/m.63814
MKPVCFLLLLVCVATTSSGKPPSPASQGSLTITITTNISELNGLFELEPFALHYEVTNIQENQTTQEYKVCFHADLVVDNDSVTQNNEEDRFAVTQARSSVLLPSVLLIGPKCRMFIPAVSMSGDVVLRFSFGAAQRSSYQIWSTVVKEGESVLDDMTIPSNTQSTRVYAKHKKSQIYTSVTGRLYNVSVPPQRSFVISSPNVNFRPGVRESVHVRIKLFGITGDVDYFVLLTVPDDFPNTWHSFALESGFIQSQQKIVIFNRNVSMLQFPQAYKQVFVVLHGHESYLMSQVQIRMSIKSFAAGTGTGVHHNDEEVDHTDSNEQSTTKGTTGGKTKEESSFANIGILDVVWFIIELLL